MKNNISFISAYVRDDESQIIRKVTNHNIKNNSLAMNDDTIIDFEMLNLAKRLSDREYEFFYNVEFVFEFSCEDEKHNKHYFRAVLKIPNTSKFVRNYWDVKKVG